MSQKNTLRTSLIGRLTRAGGAHLTIEARRRTAGRFAKLMHRLGFTHLREPEQIKAKHIAAYAKARKEEGAATRTLQNELAHLRTILRLSHREQLADSAELSNAALLTQEPPHFE